MRVIVEPDGFGNWNVVEGDRVVDRVGSKQEARNQAEQVARRGDTIQVLNKDGSLNNEFIVGDDGLTAAFDEGRAPEEGNGRRRQRQSHGGGLFGGGLF